MSFEPRYTFLPGTEITLLERPMVITGQAEHGYRVADLEQGVTTVVSFGTLVEQLQLPGARIDASLPATGGRLQQRLGGYASAQALSPDQLELGRFHLAICQAIQLYRTKVREETGRAQFKLSGRKLDETEARKFIAKIAGDLLEKKILVNPPRGGKSTALFLYKGRTLMKYFDIFENLLPDESPINALVTLDHLKGNRKPRIPHHLREIMTGVWERFGFDLRKPTVASVCRELAGEVSLINAQRLRNDLPEFIVPSEKTVSQHRDMLLTPTELLVATSGVREARNKRGRGSTDVRALLIGELVEIDECHISLVTAAKAHGFWERMSENEKEAIEECEEYIRSRWCILVMLDVASRMPLAWVIAETPNAEATLALFRMGTRDKSREKALYGCAGQPAAAVGLMHVKNDNGPGLRNTTAVSALMGMGSINSETRAFASTDRPHIERLLGTLEIEVLKALPGYTGRSPGDLPGYDAFKNGVITVEQLHEIVTRYFIDEYPYKRHYGTTMYGRRPIEVYETLNETRGQIPPIDPHLRRIHLGWEESVTPTDEGVRVFGGIWFNSDELQIKREEFRVQGKVKVFIDPESMNLATVILPMAEDPIEVKLQTTAFADMTLPEILALMAEQRWEDPRKTRFYEDQLIHTRMKRREQVAAIGVEHNLARSYSTVQECQAKAKAVFAGASVVRCEGLPGATAPGDITSVQPSGCVYLLGGGVSPLDVDEERIPLIEDDGSQVTSATGQDADIAQVEPKSRIFIGCEVISKDGRLQRPNNLKGLK